MKLRGPIFFSILLIGFLFAAFYPRVDTSEKEAVLMRTILTFMSQLHFSPKKVDDEFSKQLYDLYLDRIDGNRRFLTQEDIRKLESFQTRLDDEALNGTYEFFDLSVDLLLNGIHKTQGFYRDILAHPFDFNLPETIPADPEQLPFAKNDKELKDYWHKYLKYETMTRLADKLEKQKDAGEEMEVKSFEELEKESRDEVLELFDDLFNRMSKLKRSDRLNYYLNSITNLFDPHSDYYEPIDKENFNIRFSGRFEGIGARLQTEGDYTKVVEIIVGGPAWKQKELKENDVVLKVQQEGGDPVDVTGMQINDVVQLIRGEKGTQVRLTVKKVDGTIREIPILRDVVIIEEGFAKSLILDGEDGERIGYIYLPRFYADFEDPNGRFCAKDVAEEIEKLKTEKIDGIILDLRNNGGGSLRDVVQMSGLFIEEGPIVQVKSRDQKPEILEDVDPRVLYNGPLAVMVNSFSASASEILAAALQDYGRAVIVGSPTFGKGTVQRFFDLDRAVRGFNEMKPLGEIKVTTQKFYRINGGSTQLKGITPDILLPDYYAYIGAGEKEEEFAMEWTEIAPVKYDQKVYKLKNLERIKTQSEERILKNMSFQKVIENAKWRKTESEKKNYPLQLKAFLAMEEQQEKESEKYKDILQEVVNKGVYNLEVDLPSIHADESKKARNDDFIQSVSKDVYIKETVQILHDLIKFQ